MVDKELELLRDYSKERGLCEPMTVADLIDSHRNLINELNRTTRKEWKDEMEEARKRVISMEMDSTWIKIDKLRKMTVQELVNLIGDE